MRTHPKTPQASRKKQSSVGKSSRARRSAKSKVPRASKKHAPAPRPPSAQMAEDGGGFLSLLFARISQSELEQLNQRTHPAGRPTHRLSRAQLLIGIVFHYTVTWAGTFGEHLAVLFGITMAESSLSGRRQALPFEVFAELLQRMLRPIGKMRSSAQACYGRWKLAALDGVGFSLPNNESIKGSNCRKGGNQHGRIAFAKLNCAVLLELVMHNPLAAALGRQGESEWKLAQQLLDDVPAGYLLLGDRLYGYAAFVVSLLEKFKGRDSHFLLRVREGLKARRLKNFKDGSQL